MSCTASSTTVLPRFGPAALRGHLTVPRPRRDVKVCRFRVPGHMTLMVHTDGSSVCPQDSMAQRAAWSVIQMRRRTAYLGLWGHRALPRMSAAVCGARRGPRHPHGPRTQRRSVANCVGLVVLRLFPHGPASGSEWQRSPRTHLWHRIWQHIGGRPMKARHMRSHQARPPGAEDDPRVMDCNGNRLADECVRQGVLLHHDTDNLVATFDHAPSLEGLPWISLEPPREER